ncbi:Uncharacterised protein [uncultured archaeon]|nr:Uncharacterised protein [uncultured archaeon]
MVKVIGFILVAAGLIVSVLSKLKLLPTSLSAYSNYLGIGLVVIGIILLVILKGNSSVGKEVPIYEGKNIVGYRKVK